MFYKTVPEENNCVGVYIYFEKSDFESAENLYLNYTANFAFTFLAKVVEEVVKSRDTENFSFHYAQIRMAYPLFYRRLETITGLSFDDKSLQAVGSRAIRIFSKQIFDHFTEEMRVMSAWDFQKYLEKKGDFGYKNVWERAFCEGEIYMCLKSSNYFTLRDLITPDFIRTHMCIESYAVKLKHGEDNELYMNRSKRISDARDLYVREPEQFKTILASEVEKLPRLSEFEVDSVYGLYESENGSTTLVKRI